MLAHTAEKHAQVAPPIPASCAKNVNMHSNVCLLPQSVAETITTAVKAAVAAARALPPGTDAAALDEVFARSVASAHAVPYPRSLTGADTAPVITAISLGPSEALIAFDGVTVTGPAGRRAGAVLKRVIEVTKVWQLQGGRVGGAFWSFSDFAANLLHRYATRKVGDVDLGC